MEFYNDPTGKKTLFSYNGEYKELTQNEEAIIEYHLEMIESNFPLAYKRLCEIYDVNVKGNKPIAITKLEKFRKVRRFIRCNLLVCDNIPDVTPDGRINIENVPCPLKGTGDCKDENCICHPEQCNVLSSREIEIVMLICDCLSDQEIAKRLYISLFTAENHRKNILRKLSLHSKEEIIVWAFKNGICKVHE